MDLFNYIKQKASNAVNSVSSFVQKYPSPASFVGQKVDQNIPGGIQGGVNRVMNTLRNPEQFVPQDIPTFKPLQQPTHDISQFVRNNYTVPMLSTPKNLFNTFRTDKPLFTEDRGKALLGSIQSVATATPDPLFDLAIPASNFIKGVNASSIRGGNFGENVKSGVQATTYENPVGLGTAVTTNPTGEMVGNLAELPIALLLARKSNQAQKIAPEIVEAYKAGRVTAEEAQALAGFLKPKTASIIDTVLSGRNKPQEIEYRYKKPYGSNQADYIVDEIGTAHPVGSLTKKATKELDTNVLPSSKEVAGYLPSGDRSNNLLLSKNPKQILFPETVKEEAKYIGNKAQDVGWYDRVVLPRVERLKKALPEQLYAPLKKNVIDPLNREIADSIDWKNNYKKQLESLNVSPGSNESDLIQRYGQGKISYKGLVDQIGQAGADRIVALDKVFRQMFNETRDFANKKRVAVGLPEIPYKKDYYRQMRELGGGVSDIIDTFTSSGKSGEYSSSIFKKQGEATNFDAVESMVNYLDHVARAGFSDTVVPLLNDYTNVLRKGGVDKGVIGYLNDYADTILGIKDTRGFGKGIEKLTAPFRKAKVVGNPGSLVAQLFNYPQGVVEAGPINFMKGLGDADAIKAADSSPYLRSLGDKTSSSLVKGIFNKAVNISGNVMQSINNSTARQLWKGFYKQALANGASDAIQYADDAIVGIMGDRRIGSLSAFYESPIGRVIGAFTLENQAGINTLIKNVGEKKVGKIIGTIIAWHLANKGVETVGQGYSPFFDPVQAILDASEQWQGSDKKEANKTKAVGRIIGELTNLTPSLQNAIFTLYKAGESQGVLPNSKQIFGSEDPTWMNVQSLYNPVEKLNRNITGNPLIDKPVNVASTLLPFVNPIARGAQAVISNQRGAAVDKNNNIMYETPKDIPNIVRSIIFGQSSTPQAREYFDNDFSSSLNKKQTQAYNALPENKRSSFLQKTQESNAMKKQYDTKESKSIFDILGSKQKALPDDFVPKNDDERKLLSDQVYATLEGGEIPSKSQLSNSLFEGKTAKTNSISDRMSVFKSLSKELTNDTYTDEQKKAILAASGASEDEAAYYIKAAKDVDIKIQEILPLVQKMEKESHEKMVSMLMEGRRSIADKQLVTSEMITYLYDMGYISKNEKNMLNALKFDEMSGEPYFSRDYKGQTGAGGSGGSGSSKKRLTFAQAKKLYSIDIPSLTKGSGIKSILSELSQIQSQGDKLLSSIEQGKTKKAVIKY